MSKSIKRPFATHYIIGERVLVSQGAAKTIEGAKRATVIRIILDEYPMARIVDRFTGVTLLTLRRTQRGITVSFGRAGGDA